MPQKHGSAEATPPREKTFERGYLITALLERGCGFRGYPGLGGWCPQAGRAAHGLRIPRLPGTGSTADIFKTALHRLPNRDPERLALADRAEEIIIEALARERPGKRRLETNVEFHATLLMEAIGLPRTTYTPLFAAARVAGWVAHHREQELTGRMLRAGSRYIGPVPNHSE